MQYGKKLLFSNNTAVCVLHVRLLVFVNRLQTRTDMPDRYDLSVLRSHIYSGVNFCSNCFFFLIFFGKKLFLRITGKIAKIRTRKSFLPYGISKNLWWVSKSPIFFSLGDFNRQIVDPGSRRLPYVKRTGMFVGKLSLHAIWVCTCLRGCRGRIVGFPLWKPFWVNFYCFVICKL